MRLSMRTGFVRLIAGLFLAASFTVAAPRVAAAASAAGDGPAIWKIEKADGQGRVYLFGSVHMMKKGVNWFTPKLQRALAGSSDLVLETRIDPSGVQEISEFIRREGVYPVGDSLQKNIDPKLFGEVIKLGEKAGIPGDTMNRLKPWYASTMLGLAYIQAQGYAAATGVEATLQTIAAKRGMRISGLETVAEQMQTLAGNAPDVQEAMLRDSVDELKDLNGLLDRMSSAWLAGDTDKLDKVLVAPMRDIPAAYDALVVRRNRNWIPKIEQMLAIPGTHFVVVGVAHLVGKDGVISLLGEKGIKAERF